MRFSDTSHVFRTVPLRCGRVHARARSRGRQGVRHARFWCVAPRVIVCAVPALLSCDVCVRHDCCVYSVYSEEEELRRTISELSERLAHITASRSQRQPSQGGTSTRDQDPGDAAPGPTGSARPVADPGEDMSVQVRVGVGCGVRTPPRFGTRGHARSGREASVLHCVACKWILVPRVPRHRSRVRARAHTHSTTAGAGESDSGTRAARFSELCQ